MLQKIRKICNYNWTIKRQRAKVIKGMHSDAEDYLSIGKLYVKVIGKAERAFCNESPMAARILVRRTEKLFCEVADMIIRRKIRVPGVNGKEDRRLYIYLPLSYEYEPDLRYPVLYMFDGHNVFYDQDSSFGKSWGVGKYLDSINAPLIVVGVECNHGENNERLNEYSPFDFEEEGIGEIEGCGEKTMNWFVNKLKPMIDRKYRTLPDREHTFIGGSSMGGLMTLYALFAYGDWFSRGAALSPSIWMSYDEVCEMVENFDDDRDVILYMDYGTEEVEYQDNMIEGYGQFTNLLMKKGIAVTSRIVPWGDHSEGSWENQLPIVFSTILYGTGPERMEEE